MVDRDVIILPSFMQVEGWRKRHAGGASAGLFGQVVTTFDAWIAGLWELHGDGRALVGNLQREVVMNAVFRAAQGNSSLSGFAPMAADCMRKAAGVPQFERALDEARRGGADSRVSEWERSALALLARYEDELERLELVELGQAAAWLGGQSDRVFPRRLRVRMPDSAPLSWIQRHFFDSCAHIDLAFEAAGGADGVRRAPQGVDVRFAFPSGRLAEPGVIADIIRTCAARGDIIVACKDPLALYGQLESELSGEGASVRVQAAKPFSGTDFGRAFLGYYHCLHDDPWDPALLSDIVLSPFSGFSRDDASRIDRDLRGNRLAEREESLACLHALSEPFSQLGEIATDPDADVLIGVFENMARASARPPAWQSEQLAAMGALREAARAARALRADIHVCASVLERASLPVSFQLKGGRPSVTITTQPIAARMGRACCATLVVADLTAEDYPVSDREDAASTLFSKLGLSPEESGISRARREFCALLELPTAGIGLVRPLGDANADATYPSVVLEEFVDAYRVDPSATDDIDNPYRLPPELQGGLVERGEELLFANAEARDRLAAQPSVGVPWPRMEDLGTAAAAGSSGRCRDASSSPLGPARLSPSQIEAYLECPLRWFATRRLRLDGLDEEFGPAQKGSFAHSALEGFYSRFRQSGHMKVNAQNLGAARSLMREVLDELAQGQPDVDPGERSRLAPANELERREVQALCEQLVSYLDYEALLLPTFHPEYLEYEIGADSGVSYAGLPLVGTVDRIDVDDSGRAVIIDYKGSITGEHEIAGKTRGHAGKVQARIYAQAVKRALGLDVIGVLYVSYGRKPAAAGAYDPRAIEAAHLPNVRHESCACGFSGEAPTPLPDDLPLSDLSFGRLLDATEEISAFAVAGMGAGEISPHPSYVKACESCPVLACAKRGA